MSVEGPVTVAYIHNGQHLSFSFHHSIIRLIVHDSNGSKRVMAGGLMPMKAGTDGLGPARNVVVRDWLADPKHEWLLWLDSDMGVGPDVVDRLVASADPVTRPVVGGLCFAVRESEPDAFGGYRPGFWPVIMTWQGQGYRPMYRYPLDTVMRCDATGAACVLIHRSVFERVRDAHGPDWVGWYSRRRNPATGEMLSEDLSFCYRLGELGIPVHVDTSVKTSHHKPMWVTEEDFQRARVLESAVPVGPTVAPATEKVAVVVPVLNRPNNARPFMDSLRSSGTAADLCTVYAVADEDDPDTMAAWVAAGAQVICAGGPEPLRTFPRKANAGYRHTHEPWLLFTGDDVVFHPGWLDQAVHVARTTGADVVGTNDMHNPRVKQGQHATHPLIRRTYIDEQGAGWDGPGTVSHEGYRHWFWDNEVCESAKQRDTFAPARFSCVEHRHPYFGGAEVDDTYLLGETFVKEDQQVWLARYTAHKAQAVAA